MEASKRAFMEKIPGWTRWWDEQGAELVGRTSHTCIQLHVLIQKGDPSIHLVMIFCQPTIGLLVCWFDSHLWLATITQSTFKIATLNRFCTRIGSPCLHNDKLSSSLWQVIIISSSSLWLPFSEELCKLVRLLDQNTLQTLPWKSTGSQVGKNHFSS